MAEARQATPRTLATATAGYALVAQGKWAAWVRKQKLTDHVPLDFAQVIAALVAFVDPVLEARAADLVWDPSRSQWGGSA